ncbi:hypothetical protein ACS0TY_025874 [Phlomoides rotata]
MSELVEMSDTDYFDNLRVNRSDFNRLCYLLRHMGASRWVVKFSFKRSSQTIHTHFHNVLRVVLKLHEVLLAKPTPVDDECTHHPSWKHFKGCLGALDSTLIDVTAPEIDKARYCTRKGTVPVNVLAACDRSAANAHILRDAIVRDDGLRVSHGIMDGGTADQGLKTLRSRNDKGGRGWSVREEQVVYESMKKILREGWKT